MPLQLKLPLLMSAVLAAVLTIAFAITYASMRRSALEAVQERLARATRQLALTSATSVSGQHARYVAIGNDSVVRRALRDPMTPQSSVMAALTRAVQPTDSGMPVELWTEDGRRVAFVGNDVRTVPLVASGRPELPRRIATTFDTATGGAADSLRLGPMYLENNKVHLWMVQPIRDRDRTIGYITHQRRIAAGANTQRILQELSGDSVTMYYRNVDGSFWTAMTGDPIAPLQAVDSAIAHAANGDELLYHEERIGSSPLMIGMYVPSRGVLERPRRTMRTVLLLSLALMLAGVLASWMIGRSVARPISELTRAAGTLATGDFEVRVPEKGDVELRRLAQTFNHMAAEIGASRSALQEQTRQAEAASNAKSEFLTTMSHELRTPLNAIGGYIDLLEMGLRGPISALQKRDLERIKASQQHLLGLISGVLDLARVEAGKVNYELVHVAVDPFLAGLDALIAPQAEAKSLTLEHVPGGKDLAVVADREKLRQILLNLLSNAIRHTPPGGKVTLSAEGRGSRVAIVVEDTGPGIPPEKRDVIFEPFVQLDRSLTQMQDGLGLGLAISRDLARGMYGELTIEPYTGPGARFVVSLPRGIADAAAPMNFSGELPVVSSS